MERGSGDLGTASEHPAEPHEEARHFDASQLRTSVLLTYSLRGSVRNVGRSGRHFGVCGAGRFPVSPRKPFPAQDMTALLQGLEPRRHASLLDEEAAAPMTHLWTQLVDTRHDALMPVLRVTLGSDWPWGWSSVGAAPGPWTRS